MTGENFRHVNTWVFDLDNTLYPPHTALFDQIEAKMVNWLMRELKISQSEADLLRNKYWKEYGTTLAGLMEHHDTDADAYLADVHDISFHPLEADPILRAAIENLPGRKIVYTNGSRPYAERVLSARGLENIFEGIYGVEHANFEPKPRKAAFDLVFKKAHILPREAAMFEDEIRNLVVPHALGMRTVHVAPEAKVAEHVHHHTENLSAFLSNLL
ncbi:pyrimidine 5'-nucleotidase [Lentibacter sp.]|uniref:pyrimidine 5'-nucleotidase n=1 Tax=Lentibacter sp. TaxID=2024994 RepID=UPI003F6D49F5